MSSNKSTLNIIAIVGLILVALTAFGIWQLSKPPAATKNQSEQTALKVNKTALDELAKPENYGQSISTDEPGFGRENPFAPYK